MNSKISNIVVMLLITLISVSCVAAKPTEIQPLPTVDRLTPPPMPKNPTQADKGANVYFLVCMACHGDRGQGLTDEWRDAFGEEDSNCWQAECHGNSHPFEGFRLVDTVPPVFGPGTMIRFDNAQELHDYLVKTMPWWNPGYRPADEYWWVSAYLMRKRGVLPDGIELNEGNAVVFKLRPASPVAKDTRPFSLAVAGLLIGAACIMIIQSKYSHP